MEVSLQNAQFLPAFLLLFFSPTLSFLFNFLSSFLPDTAYCFTILHCFISMHVSKIIVKLEIIFHISLYDFSGIKIHTQQCGSVCNNTKVYPILRNISLD